MNVAQF